MEGKQKERPEIGKFMGFDHITLYVGNALQASSFYVSRLGFAPYAYEVKFYLKINFFNTKGLRNRKQRESNSCSKKWKSNYLPYFSFKLEY